MGAMSSAMMNMAMNAAGGRSERGRVAVGAGWQHGESALSLGYSKQTGERGSFSNGGAFSNGDNSAGIGFGVDLYRTPLPAAPVPPRGRPTATASPGPPPEPPPANPTPTPQRDLQGQ